MSAVDYVVSYDISSPKRLRKVAKELERVGMRIQYSIFFVPGLTHEEILEVVGTIDKLIDPLEDDVRIYSLLDTGIALGTATDLKNFAIFS